ncbi:MAG: GntR family transcriptional regulator [Eubacteriales bacterium]
MVSFTELQLNDDTPIYVQIIRFIKVGIVARTIGNDDEIPSRRAVSALLGVNPNTIQKAYKLLEEEGFLHSQTGAKSTITLTEDRVQSLKKELVESDLMGVIQSLQEMGIDKGTGLELLNQLWEENHET